MQLRVRDPLEQNLLFYGNSYSQGNGTMPAMVGALAQEAGAPAPWVTAALVGGQTLGYHRTNPGQVAAIGSLPLGETWDFVVMQGHSQEATRLRNPAQFRADAVGLVGNVKAHSPNARAVLFQTWARGPGHSFYPGSFSGPVEMHQEIQANYALAAADIDAAFGPGTAMRAPVGDAVALLAFDPSLYTADLSHPTPPTTLLASMAVFAALYGVRVCDMAPDFSGSSALVNRLAQYGMGTAEWQRYAGIGERVAPRWVRRYPGSSEDLLLRSGPWGAEQSCPSSALIGPGRYGASVTSPNGLYGAAPAVLLATGFASGSQPAPLPGWAELVYAPGGTVVVSQGAALGGGLGLDFSVPRLAPGLTLVLQGVALAPSAARQNPWFTTTDGHELVTR